MAVTLTFLGPIKQAAGTNTMYIDAASTVSEAIATMHGRFPNTRRFEKMTLAVLNGSAAKGAETLKDGDELVVMVAIAGG
jgi:molybdopterin converting factor small subunit